MAVSSLSPPSHFLALPVEIRELIYQHLLSVDTTKQTSDDGYARYKFDLSLFRTNRQIHDESLHIFRRLYQFVRIQTPWPQAQQHVASEGYVPIICSGQRAATFKNHHMLVDIDTPEFPFTADIHSFVCIVDDLPLFTQMWFYSDLGHSDQLNPHLRLTLIIQDPYVPVGGEPTIPVSLQRRLLKPFSIVKNLYTFDINGPSQQLSKSLEKDVRKAMTAPYDSPEKCLEAADRLKSLGNDALNKGDYREAIRQYEASFLAMHILVKGRRRNIWADAFFHADLKGGIFDGQNGHTVRLLLRIRLVANIVLAYLKLGEAEEARFWGMRTITLFRDAVGGTEDTAMQGFFASKEIGKIYYRTALAKKELGDRGGARELINIAAKYLPGDRIVQEEVGRLALKLG
ncbi:MAG: hypothetical protein Q9160_008677 [Pyrenula sp. 1 TL-2023]